jgi:dipeptidyl aminopeptidase/acylaminoacyl peptidase
MGCLPETCGDAYAAAANTPLAGALAGDLLLIHGTHDDDVPFGDTMRMADALIRAGKHFDMMVFPEATHTSFLGPYYQDIVRRYLVEHLLE